MANYDLLYEGSEVQDILDTGKSLEDDGYIFLGTATPSTIPGTPIERVAYVGGPGTYNNFGTTVVVPSGSIVVITYSGSAWSKTVINASLPVSTTLENNDTTIPTGKAVKTAIDASVSAEETARGDADTALDGRIDTIEGEIPSEASSNNKLADKAFVTTITNALQTAVNGIKSNIDNGYVFAGIATPSGTPVSGKVFYLAKEAGTYTNFGGLVVTQGINILKYNGTAWSQEQLIGIDDVPTDGSDNLVKSGGISSFRMLTPELLDNTELNGMYRSNDSSTSSQYILWAGKKTINSVDTPYQMRLYLSSGDLERLLQKRYYDTTNNQWGAWESIVLELDQVPALDSHNLLTSGSVYSVLLKYINQDNGCFYLPYDFFTYTGFIKPADGTLNTNATSYRATDYILLRKGCRVSFLSWASSGALAIAVYSSKTESDYQSTLSKTGNSGAGVIDYINETNADVYIRLSLYYSNREDTRAYIDNFGIANYIHLEDKADKDSVFGEILSIACTHGGFIKADQTEPHTSTTYGYSDFIPVSAGDVLIFSLATGGTVYGISGYSSADFSTRVNDDSVNVLGIPATNNFVSEYRIIVPSGVNYVVLCLDNRVAGTTVILKKNVVQSIEEQALGRYKGKKVSVLGDSISTFAGISPYTGHNHYPTNPISDADINQYTQMWWGYLLTNLQMEIGCIDAYAGSGVSGDDDGVHAVSESRLENLGSNGTPDLIIIQVATNDVGVTLGDYAFWKLAQEQTYNKYVFRQAYAFIIERCMQLYPNTRIVAMSPITRLPQGWWDNNGYSMQDMWESIKTICENFHIPFIDMSECGINVYNASTYLHDNRSGEPEYKVHPNVAGMKLMGEFVVKQLKNINLF